MNSSPSRGSLFWPWLAVCALPVLAIVWTDQAVLFKATAVLVAASFAIIGFVAARRHARLQRTLRESERRWQEDGGGRRLVKAREGVDVSSVDEVPRRAQPEDAIAIERGANLASLGIEQKRTERALELFRTLIDRSNDAIEVLDPETGRFLDANEKSCTHLGYSREEFLNLTVFDIETRTNRDVFEATVAELRKTGSLLWVGIHRRKDGSTFPVEVSLSYVDLDRQYVVSVVRDITERERAREALEASEYRYRDLVENSQDLMCTHDLDGRLLSANEVAARLTGYSLEALMSMNFRDLLVPETRHLFAAYLDEIKRSGKSHGILKIRTASGEIRYWQYHNTMRAQGSEQPVVRGSARDATLEILAKKSLVASEKRYRDLFEHNLAGVYHSTLDGKILDCNEAYARIYGYDSREEAMRLGAEAFYPNSEARHQYLDSLQQQGRLVNLESLGHKKDGSPIWLLENSNLVADEEGEITEIVGTLVDITDRKQAEETLRVQSAALNATSISIVIMDRNGLIVWTNPAFTALIGYSAEESVGRDLMKLAHSEARGEGFYQRMWSALHAGEVWQGDMTNRRKDGSLYLANQSITPVKDQEGEITHFISWMRDLTEQRQLEARLQQAEKMDTVGRLAGGIAHDFNNLLTVISGTAEIAADHALDNAPLQTDLEEIRTTAERAASLTRQLLAFSRQQIMKPESLSLTKLVEGMRNMLARLIGERIQLVVEAASESCYVLADRSSIEQVVLNLAVNGRDAMPDGGKLMIATRSVELAPSDLARRLSLAPGPYVLLAVQDTGVGMDRESLERLFEPFYTTKELGKGTGLGMSTVFGIVHQSGGSIGVESEVGKGTRFEVYLPRAGEEALEGQPQSEARSRLGSEVILVVEDQAAIRKLSRRILESSGYTVLTAGDGQEALNLVGERDVAIDLLLSDMVLPGLSGPTTAKRILEIRPKTKVLFMSGHAHDPAQRDEVSEDTVHFIAKPYSKVGLLRKVREALDSPN